MKGPWRRALPVLAALGALTLSVAPHALGATYDPLWAPNLAPHQVGLLQPPAQVPPPPGPAMAVGLRLAYATVYTVEGSGEKRAVLDLETARLGLTCTRRWTATAVDVEVPLLWSGRGSFDGFLIGYHKALGLPDGDRDEGPRNRYRYEVTTPDGRYAPDARGWGLGDVRVGLRHTLASGSTGNLAVRAIVELPTGRAADGRGNGHLDAGVGLLSATRPGRLRGFANLDVLYQGGGPDPALPLETSWGLSAALGGSATTPEGRWGVTGQVQYRTTPYRTGIAALDRDVILLAAGGRVALGSRWVVSVGFTEDLAVHASPDFTGLFTLCHSWGKKR